MIVDSHCHVSTRWYEPVDTLLFEMDRCGVDKAVLIQLLGSFDNSDMADARRNHPGRFAFVAALPPEQADAAAVKRAAGEGAAGLRLRASSSSPGEDPDALWAAAEEAKLAVSCVGPAESFVDGRIAGFAESFPGLPIVLEHLGGLARPDVGDRGAMVDPVLGLAAYPNIFIKMPGLGQLAPRVSLDGEGVPLDLEGVAGLLESAVAAFGPSRIMWGSDFPPVASREGYGHALAWPRELLHSLDDEALGAIFGGTAARIFGL
ncbi:amidohydrolase family protein [Parasphingopyxis marina]|uniref:Amidohydrolase n=1 Tax=Parasphingopyxis marina TaxID=2761622 RepID=A0A842I269_9SPHN|nr:amidohydrolase family protein [Parasphingopyxis marina]MBC2778911.1 amidohydrolase [Parasphingopyxis marina]